MTKHAIPWTLLALAACASSTPPPDPALEAEFRMEQQTKSDQLMRQKTLEQVLLNVDQAIDRYVSAKLTSEFDSSARLAQSLHDFVRRSVLERFDDFVRLADSSSKELRGNRAIAAAALGFSMRPEALTPLLNAARADDPVVVTNAMLGLGVLADPRTPADAIGRVLEDRSQDLHTRICASWALLQVQEKLHDTHTAVAIWLRILSQPVDQVDPAIQMHALRSLGFTRDKQYAKAVEPYVSHPVPKVREAAAIALGRLGDPAAHNALLALIGPAEQNPNVRLAARKALMALAGGVDREYDVAEWRKVFDMGN